MKDELVDLFMTQTEMQLNDTYKIKLGFKGGN